MTAPSTCTTHDLPSTKELANLLGRELVQAKGRIGDLENQLREKSKELKRLKVTQASNRAPRISENVSELQQEVDRYKETEAKLQHKIKSVRGQHAQLVNKDKKIKSLEDQIADLTSQREIAREEAEILKSRYREEKRIRQELRIQNLGEKEKSVRGWQEVLSTMAALPLCPARPEHRNLAPVAKRGVHLSQYLRSDPSTKAYADASLFMPGRMTWCSSVRGHHHALAFAPTHIFDTQSRKWEKKFIMEHWFGKTVELFFQEKWDVLYAGTYKSLRLKTSTIDSLPESEIEGLLPHNMAESALSDDFPNAPSSSAHKGTISKLYRDRVLSLECMGLQCIGFNKKFYESLVARHRSSVPVKRHLEIGIEDRKSKKRKL